MRNRWLFVLLLPVALLALVLLIGVMLLVVVFAPPALSAGAFVVLGLGALWFFLRRRSGSGPVSELSLLGRQSASKDGLL